MVETVQCESCGTPLLASESDGSKPTDHDECPNCGHRSFWARD
ncbi:MAG: hypothetical protein ABEJ26_12610 [Halosimplex sp.]